MKKIIALLAAFALAFVMSFALASSASATGDIPSPDNNKEVTLCHYDGSNEHGGSGKYSKITVSVNAFYNAGHIDHVNDIYEGFTWTDNHGVEHVVPSRGDIALLQYPNCEAPVVDNKVAAPAVNVVDQCGTDDDKVTPAVSDKYTTTVTKNGLVYTVVATATEGNVFDAAQSAGWTLSNGNKTATKTFTLTNEACDLPETGSTTTNVAGGIVIVALLGGLGFFLLRRRKLY